MREQFIELVSMRGCSGSFDLLSVQHFVLHSLYEKLKGKVNCLFTGRVTIHLQQQLLVMEKAELSGDRGRGVIVQKWNNNIQDNCDNEARAILIHAFWPDGVV